jgi:hypothetical protein
MKYKWTVSFTLWPRKSPLYPLERTLCWLQSRSRRCAEEKNLPESKVTDWTQIARMLLLWKLHKEEALLQFNAIKHTAVIKATVNCVVHRNTDNLPLFHLETVHRYTARHKVCSSSNILFRHDGPLRLQLLVYRWVAEQNLYLNDTITYWRWTLIVRDN